jgi:hypothetical protein
MREGISDRRMFGKFSALTLAALSFVAVAQGATLKKIVAVSSFENKTPWRGQVDLGDGMAWRSTPRLPSPMSASKWTTSKLPRLAPAISDFAIRDAGC